MESKLSELSIQQNEAKTQSHAIIEKSQKLEKMYSDMLSEMTIEFETIRNICENNAQQASRNKYLVPTSTVNYLTEKATHVASSTSGPKPNATETKPAMATDFSKSKVEKLLIPELNIPSMNSTPREKITVHKPLLDHDYVMYESPLIKGIDWNASTPSPVDSPHATSSPKISNDEKQANLSQYAATLATTPIMNTTEKYAPTTNKTEFVKNTKLLASLDSNEETFAPRYQFTNEEVDDWRETLGDIHREAFDRKTEFAWENFTFVFTAEEVTDAILYLLKYELVTLYGDFDLSSIESFLTPYILDAVSALAAAQSNPNDFNEICSNYISNSMEDLNKEDYIRIDIKDFLPRVYDLLLTRMMYRQTSFMLNTKGEQLNDHYCKNLFDLFLVYDGNKPRPLAKLDNSYDHQAVFTSAIVTVFATKMAKLSVPHDVFMAILVFLCYAE